MTKDEQKKAKTYLKKMQKALKKAPIGKSLVAKNSENPWSAIFDAAEQNWDELNSNEDKRLLSAKEKLFSRLGKDDREKAHEWVFRHARLVGGDE